MRLGALDPSVGTDLKGFTGNPDNISKILKVSAYCKQFILMGNFCGK